MPNSSGPISIESMAPDVAHHLSPLIAAYVQEMQRGAPRRPDDYYAALLLQDKTAEVLGVRIGGEMVGFALYFDLPDAISGLRAGQIELLYILPEHRKSGAARALVDHLVTMGHQRDWVHLRWMVPEKVTAQVEVYSNLAQPAPWKSYLIPMSK